MTLKAAPWSSATGQSYTHLFRFAEIAASPRKNPSRGRDRIRSCLISPVPPETKLGIRVDCLRSSACCLRSFLRHAFLPSWWGRPCQNTRQVTDCSANLVQIYDCMPPDQIEGAALPSNLRVQMNSSTGSASIEPESSSDNSLHPHQGATEWLGTSVKASF